MVLNKGPRAKQAVLVRLLRTVHGAHNGRELSLRIQECAPHTEVGWIVEDGIKTFWEYDKGLF